MVSTSIKRYNRCKWMGVISAIFAIMMVACTIPGILGVAPGGNQYNDTLLYLGLIDLIFAGLFFTGWWSCQIEVEDVPERCFIAGSNRTSLRQFGSMSSESSGETGSVKRQLITEVDETVKTT